VTARPEIRTALAALMSRQALVARELDGVALAPARVRGEHALASDGGSHVVYLGPRCATGEWVVTMEAVRPRDGRPLWVLADAVPPAEIEAAARRRKEVA
jgi:hypothetical protein